jgi:hypothetical protein
MLQRIIVLCLVALVGSGANASLVYTGSLSTEEGLTGTGIWVTGEKPTTFGWEVSLNGSNWHYKYTLSVPKKEISHFNIEVSDTFRCDDLLNESGNFNSVYIGSIFPQSGNPGMPSSINGIKFDETWGVLLVVEFDTPRSPVWGDFYAKNGNTDSIPNAVWNSGFGPDPLDSPTNGSFNNKILVPDTVPEPASLGLLFLGAPALFLKR